MSQFSQVLDIFEIWIYYILKLYRMPKVTSTHSNLPENHDGVVIEGRIFSSSVQERYSLNEVFWKIWLYYICYLVSRESEEVDVE